MSGREYIWFLNGALGWDALEETRAKVDSTLYGYCESASDEGKVFVVSLVVKEMGAAQ